MTEASFPLVRTPLQVGTVRLRNRIVLPAMTTNYGEQHLPSAQHAAYHERRAAGGVGLIIFESIRVHENSLGRPQAVNGFDPACVEPFREIVRRVHAHGAHIFGQVIHLGRQIDGDFEGTVSWGASPLAWTPTAVAPHEMTEDDMNDVVEGHLATARHLVAAGFDGIELQMAHGHLLQQFISPLSNARQDDFGGSLENRMRFPARVLAALRAELGDRFTLGIRLGAAEFLPEGLQVEQAAEVAVALADQTPVDFVNVSHSAYHGSRSLGTQMADMNFTDVEAFRELPRRIRTALRDAGHETPVFAVCKFTRLDQAEAALADGVADAIAMARAHLADPELVNKSLTGRGDTIRECIGCNQGCVGMLEKNLPIRCLVNPDTGHEADPSWSPSPSTASTRRRVLVIGGGPAGMECAAVAASRGHDTRLLERGDTLGGMLIHAVRMPRRAAFGKFLDQQRRAIEHAGVRVSLNAAVDVRAVVDAAADHVVLATGARPVVPVLPGGGTALGLVEALDAIDADQSGSHGQLGDRVAVADLTGDWAALSLVERLADLGKHVTLYTQVAGYAWRTTMYSTLATSGRLYDKHVRIRTLTEVSGWDGHRVALIDRSTGEQLGDVEHDSLVYLVHPVANNAFYQALRAAGCSVSQIGDALAPRTALEAVHQGHRLGIRL